MHNQACRHVDAVQYLCIVSHQVNGFVTVRVGFSGCRERYSLVVCIAERVDFDNVEQALELSGRVRGTLLPPPESQP